MVSKCILSYSIIASQCFSQLPLSWSPSAYPSCTIPTAKCISKLAQSRPPSSALSDMISDFKCISQIAVSWPQSALLSHSISASKCISKLAPSLPPSAALSSTRYRLPSVSSNSLHRSRPPSKSPSSPDHDLQVHLQVLSISVSRGSGYYAPVLSAARLAVCIYIARHR
jgi:hypothetical protein